MGVKCVAAVSAIGDYSVVSVAGYSAIGDYTVVSVAEWSGRLEVANTPHRSLITCAANVRVRSISITVLSPVLIYAGDVPYTAFVPIARSSTPIVIIPTAIISELRLECQTAGNKR